MNHEKIGRNYANIEDELDVSVGVLEDYIKKTIKD